MSTKVNSLLIICVILLSDIDFCYSYNLQRLKRKAKSSHRHLSNSSQKSSTRNYRNHLKYSRLKRTKTDPLEIAAYVLDSLKYAVMIATFIVSFVTDKKVDSMHNDVLSSDQRLREIKQNLAIEMIKSSQNYFNMILLNAIFGFIQLKQHSEKNGVVFTGGENILVSVKTMKIELENLEYIYVTGNNSFFGEENFFQARTNSLSKISGSLADNNQFSYFSMFTKSIHIFLFRSLLLLAKVLPEIGDKVNAQLLQIPIEYGLIPFEKLVSEYEVATKKKEITKADIDKYLVCSAKKNCTFSEFLQGQNIFEDLIEETYSNTIPKLDELEDNNKEIASFLAFKSALLLIHLGYWMFNIIYFIGQFLNKQEVVPIYVTIEDVPLTSDKKDLIWLTITKDFIDLIKLPLEFHEKLNDPKGSDDVQAKSSEFNKKLLKSFSKSKISSAFELLKVPLFKVFYLILYKELIFTMLKQVSVIKVIFSAIDLVVAIYKLIVAILKLVRISKENKDNQLILSKMIDISSKHSEFILCKFHIVIHKTVEKFSDIMMQLDNDLTFNEVKSRNIEEKKEELVFDDIVITNDSNNDLSELIKVFSENPDKKLDYFIYGICIISPIFCSQYLNEKLLLQSGVSSEMVAKIMDFANSMANYGPINVAFLKMRNLDFSTVGTVDKDYYSFLSTQKFYTSVNYISLYSNNANIIYQRGSKCSYGLKQIGLVKYDDTDHFKLIIVDIPKIKSKFADIFGNSVSVAIQIYEQANEKKKIEKFVLAFIYGRADFCSFSGIAPQKNTGKSLKKKNQSDFLQSADDNLDNIKTFPFYFKFSLELVTELKRNRNEFEVIDNKNDNYWESQGIKPFHMKNRKWDDFLGKINYYDYSSEIKFFIQDFKKFFKESFKNCVQLIIVKLKECSDKTFYSCKAVSQDQEYVGHKISTVNNNNPHYLTNTNFCQNLIKEVEPKSPKETFDSKVNIGEIYMGIADIKTELQKLICEGCTFITANDKIPTKLDPYQNLLGLGTYEVLPMKWKLRHNSNREFPLTTHIPFLKKYISLLSYKNIKFTEKNCNFNCVKLPIVGQIYYASTIVKNLFRTEDTNINAIDISKNLPEEFHSYTEIKEGFTLHSTFDYKSIRKKSLYHPSNLFTFNSIITDMLSSLDDKLLLKFVDGIQVNHYGGIRIVIPGLLDFSQFKFKVVRFFLKNKLYRKVINNPEIFSEKDLDLSTLKGEFFILWIEEIPKELQILQNKLELQKENIIYFEIYLTRPLNEGYLEFDTKDGDVSFVKQFLDKQWLPYFEINDDYNESEFIKKPLDELNGPEPFTIPSHYFLTFPVSDDWSLNTRIWVRHSYNSPKEYDEICSTSVLDTAYIDDMSKYDNSLMYDPNDLKRKKKLYSMKHRRSKK